MLPPTTLATDLTSILNSFDSWFQHYLHSYHPRNAGCATFLLQWKVM